MRLGVRKPQSDSPPEESVVLPDVAEPEDEEAPRAQVSVRPDVQNAIREVLFDRINMDTIGRLAPEQLFAQIEALVHTIAGENRYQLSAAEQKFLSNQIANDMMGSGPLEPLMKDDTVTDIMVNGPDRVFVERNGRVVLTDIKFRDEAHLRQIATRMARNVQRRLDESSPMVDARLPDGSRVNIVIPPISLDGTAISIRRFSKVDITLDTMVRYDSISEKMKAFLEIIGRCKINVIVSGGTSSGKTTLLNAISRYIGKNERVITIEDSAELRLQQPHVLRLETRPPAIEGAAAVTQRDLVRNALRMRPDRIILGEVRAGEAFDLLQAMNTGHEGSMGTMHANSPRDALSRLESMILMAGFELPVKAIRSQIASAVNIIIQAERMVDGVRRVTKITEVTGMEGDLITTQDIFEFKAQENRSGRLVGAFESSNIQLRCIEKIRRHGLDKELRRLFASGGLDG
jgi:pilus assembly protein CpaF